MDLIYWDHYYDKVLFINFAIVVGLFTLLRLFSGSLARTNADVELLRKDNPAFGISLAGIIFGVTIILSGTMYGRPEQGVLELGITTVLHGVVGIAMMILARIIFDKITLPAISIRNEIVQGNVAVAIADVGNIFAAAIIIRAVLVWVTSNSLTDMLPLLAAYVISQIILTLTTYFRFKIMDVIKKRSYIQKELKERNVAVALRFAGQKIGTALAIAIGSNLVVTEERELFPVLVAWFLVSIGVILVMKFLSYIAESIILFRINLDSEVIDQKNIALGVIQAVIIISIGLLFLEW